MKEVGFLMENEDFNRVKVGSVMFLKNEGVRETKIGKTHQNIIPEGFPFHFTSKLL